MFLRQYQRQRKCFLSEIELKKALRDTLTRAAWLGPVIFDWFVLSMRMQVILDSSFARPGSAPIWGGKKGEFRDLTTARWVNLPILRQGWLTYLRNHVHGLMSMQRHVISISRILIQMFLWYYSKQLLLML